MSVLHYITLRIDINRVLSVTWVILDYSLKATLTIPLLWLFFIKTPSINIWKKAALHIFTIIVFTFLWIKLYYIACDYFNIYRNKNSRQVWYIYLTVLFYVVQFGSFHLYVYSKKLRKAQLLSAELSKLNAQSELAALKAQLNPHFLYNVFNTINAAIPTSAKNARNMVNELSDLFRYQLKASKEEMVLLSEEIDFVRKYLDLEKERFGERLQYHIYIDENSQEIVVPPLIIQPLVENSVKHGISPLIEGGKITVTTNVNSNELQITVCDTGKGIQGQKKSALLQKGIGLSNTNARLLKMYGKGLHIEENDNGFCISLSITKH